MRILVTGGAGFIGSNFVVRSLQTRPNIDVVVMDALTYAGKKENLEPNLEGIEFVHGDIRDSSLVDQLVSSVDLVINFAAESHNDNSLKDPAIFFQTNVMGIFNIASSCVKYGVRLHHISTDEVFGDLPLDSTSEFDVNSPYRPSSPYSASKASSDHLVKAWVRSFGLQATISNCCNNYGPRQHWEKLIPATIKSIFLGEKPVIYGNGKNVRDWIHVDDHTDGIWAVIDKGLIGETYLLGSRDRVSNLRVVQGILKITNRAPEDFIFVKDRPGHDRMYAVNPSSSMALGWKPRHTDILGHLDSLVNYYLKVLRDSGSLK